VPGIDVVGPLPDPVQKTLESAVAIFAESARRGAALRLLEVMQTTGAAQLFHDKGLEPASF
jgi:molybdate transport system substrate-binding protein